jgi:uncharacterized protein
MRKLLLLLLLPLLAIATHAASGHITLLTVADAEGEPLHGGTADLYLTVKPGTGSIYIDSFPLTRIDTQSSVRYANKIACDILQEDCSRYDFFYTIRARSSIVGGPSAGAAMTVLTVAVLDGEDLAQDAAMTGTINSGGIIGPVAGVPAKISGAREAGIKKVLIPSLITNNELNISNASQSGLIGPLSADGFAVIRVGTVEEALYEFTGKNYTRELPELQVPQEYTKRMSVIAADICNRTVLLESEAAQLALQHNDTNNYTVRIARAGDHHYSRASLCFSKNIELAKLLQQNASAEERYELYRALRISMQELDSKTAQQPIETINDLEAYAIVKERIIEARMLLDDANLSDLDPDSLAYAQERLLSAKSWSAFFGMGGDKLELDPLYLQSACMSKLGEAEERVNYIRLYAPTAASESERLLLEAQAYSTTEPIICIFTASKAKAQADLLASAISIDRENVDMLLQQKLSADEAILRKQYAKGFFPILGYSYAQYAGDLRDESPFSALTFSEYALELSNLDIYFPKDRSFTIPAQITDALLYFMLGSIFGAGMVLIFFGKRRR